MPDQAALPMIRQDWPRCVSRMASGSCQRCLQLDDPAAHPLIHSMGGARHLKHTKVAWGYGQMRFFCGS